MKEKWRQRFVSLISSVVFLGFLWVLFKKMIIVTWITMPWWGLILLLVVLFIFIETMVSRVVGAKEPLDRAKDSAKESLTTASQTTFDGLEAVKRKLAERQDKP